MFGVPRTLCHWYIGLYIGIFCYWVLLHYNMSIKTIAGGFDGMVHFLKIEKNFNKSTNTLSGGFNKKPSLKSQV